MANKFAIVILSSRDVDEIYDLYSLCRSLSPYGYLANRTREDYRELFRDPDKVIGTGIRHGSRLVAHSICHRLTTNPYRDNPVLAGIDPSTSPIFHGDGTMVHPDYRGRLLAKRIFQLRREQMTDRRIDHLLGLVAIDNLVSIGNVLLAGAILVGFSRDETAMNFVAYGGRLRTNVRSDVPPTEIDWRDHVAQKRLFGGRYIVRGLSRPVGSPSSAVEAENRKFSFLPMV